MKLINDLMESAGDDGASVPVLPETDYDPNELELIMEAWYQERQVSIESEILLSQARELLRRILIDDGLTKSNLRKIKSWLRMVGQDGRRNHSTGV
jgi:hypothetical protein